VTVSVAGGSGKTLAHNNRLYESVVTNNYIDPSRTPDNVTVVRDPIRDVYDELFGDAVAAYNKGKRKDRQITSYYDQVQRSTKTNAELEMVIAIGSSAENTDRLVWNKKAQTLVGVAESLQKTFENFRFYNVVVHLDESNPHIHANAVPWFDTPDAKRGMSRRVGKEGALKAMGFGGGRGIVRQFADRVEWMIGKCAAAVGFDYQRAPKGKARGTLSVEDYKAVMASTKQEQAEIIENKILDDMDAHVDEDEAKYGIIEPQPIVAPPMLPEAAVIHTDGIAGLAAKSLLAGLERLTGEELPTHAGIVDMDEYEAARAQVQALSAKVQEINEAIAVVQTTAAQAAVLFRRTKERDDELNTRADRLDEEARRLDALDVAQLDRENERLRKEMDSAYQQGDRDASSRYTRQVTDLKNELESLKSDMSQVEKERDEAKAVSKRRTIALINTGMELYGDRYRDFYRTEGKKVTDQELINLIAQYTYRKCLPELFRDVKCGHRNGNELVLCYTDNDGKRHRDTVCKMQNERRQVKTRSLDDDYEIGG
jgi:hypothetical protein